MIDDAVRAALERALGSDPRIEAATAALRRVDPMLRGAARRRLREVVADAQVATQLRQGPDAERHALRLAYLLLSRALPSRAARDDVDAVEAAYEAERTGRGATRFAVWWPTALAITLAAAVVGVGAKLVARPAQADGRAPASEAPATESALAPPLALGGAFAEGGVPAKAAGDDAVARVLGADLPAFLIALDRRTEARRTHDDAAAREAAAAMKEAGARALDAEARTALGPRGAHALEAILVAAQTASGDALGKAAAELDDELAATGRGFFVDADVLTDTEDGKHTVLVYTFRVTSVSVFRAGAQRVNALRLRRLDKLNWSHTLVGFTRPTLRSAAVLLDQLEEQVVTMIAPALVDRAPMTLFDAAAPADLRGAVEARAGELLRLEYGAIQELDHGAATKLGKLLGERAAIFARNRGTATARGAILIAPKRLRMPEGFAASLAGLVGKEDLSALAQIDAALDDRTRADAFEALRDALADSVERHEVQHRLDAMAPPRPLPAVLEARVGPLTEDGKERWVATASRAELSAYLGELARDARTPRVGLSLIARFLFDADLHGTPESYAALTILEGLGQALGIDGAGAMLRAGKIDRRAASVVWTGLVAAPPERLRDEAGKLWGRLFGAPLPELRRMAPGAPE
jgi:hypothetical protein